MEHFVTDEVDRIKIDKDHWVDIKRRMTYGDQDLLTASFMDVKPEIEEGPSGERRVSDIDIKVKTGNIPLLCINVKAWNLEISPGQVAPINEDTLRQLDPDVAQKLVKEIKKRNLSPKA